MKLHPTIESAAFYFSPSHTDHEIENTARRGRSLRILINKPSFPDYLEHPSHPTQVKFGRRKKTASKCLIYQAALFLRLDIEAVISQDM